MMVSPEWYYEENIKGKSTDQIASIIRSLKRKIKQLETVVANPKDYPQEWMICPAPEVQLEMHRLYLQKANVAVAIAIKREEN